MERSHKESTKPKYGKTYYCDERLFSIFPSSLFYIPFYKADEYLKRLERGELLYMDVSISQGFYFELKFIDKREKSECFQRDDKTQTIKTCACYQIIPYYFDFKGEKVYYFK